jgi:hypothetical protein
MQLEIYNPRDYMYWNKHRLKPEEHPIESCNFTIYNFGPAARVAIACVDAFTDPHMQTFVVYPGRNLLCPCRLKGCYITVTSIERDTLIRMENGKEHRMNLQLYQGGLDKTYIPTLRDICISNIYSLNWDFLFGTSHTFLPKSIIEHPTSYIKRCVECFCIRRYFSRDDKNTCLGTIGLCRGYWGTGIKDIGKPNCPCQYCRHFNPYPFSLPVKGGALPDGSSDLLGPPPADPDPSGPEDTSQRYGCLPCVIL